MSAITEGSVCLSGAIKRVIYKNPRNCFCVLQLACFEPLSYEEIVTVVGYYPRPYVGIELSVEGHWVSHPRFGQQVKAKTIHLIKTPPIALIKAILRSNFLDGLNVKKIISQNDVSILSLVEGGAPEDRHLFHAGLSTEEINAALLKLKHFTAVWYHLKPYGLSLTHVHTLWEAFGEKTEHELMTMPYHCLHLLQLPFGLMDAFSLDAGHDPSSSERLGAACLGGLQYFSQYGHTQYPCDALVSYLSEQLRQPRQRIQHVLEDDNAKAWLIHHNEQDRSYVSLRCYEAQEHAIARDIVKRCDHPLAYPLPCSSASIQLVEEHFRLCLSKSQRDAVKSALQHPVSVMTGGPGVGKTTVVRIILSLLEKARVSTVLCAPTGRAAKRLFEATGRDAKTIHRLLGMNPQTQEVTINLTCHYLIIDEFSMVDVPLFTCLLDALPQYTNVLLIGDADQLPSVGPGAILADIVSSSCIPVAHLSEVYRQAAQSFIIVNSHRVQAGEYPIDAQEEFKMVEAHGRDAIYQALKEQLQSFERLGDSMMEQVQVLAPMQTGALGVRALNVFLQQHLNPTLKNGKGFYHRGIRYFVGDKVIQLVNNYEKNVFNGDVGMIADIDLSASILTVDYEGVKIDYATDMLDELSLAYALTIHKSQGSEYPVVIIVLDLQHEVLLKRNLLYTAMTRGKQQVVLIGDPAAWRYATDNQVGMHRYTGLARMLNACRSMPEVRAETSQAE